CSEMVYPVIPIFVVGVLKAPAAALGLGEGLAESLVAFVKGWSGRSSDLTGRRMPYVRVGYTLSALGKPLIGLAGAWPMVAFARSLDRFGKGV
ncbi:MFS transporter, partial [Acinetobacter baumannii]